MVVVLLAINLQVRVILDIAEMKVMSLLMLAMLMPVLKLAVFLDGIEAISLLNTVIQKELYRRHPRQHLVLSR